MNKTEWNESLDIEAAILLAPFLSGIPHDELEHFFGMGAGQNWYSRGEEIFRQDDPVKELYIIVDGEVSEERVDTTPQGGSRRSLERVSKNGALVGHYDLLYAKPHSTSAYASTDCRILEIKADAVNWLLHRYPLVRNAMAPMERINRLRTMPLTSRMDLTMMSFVAEAGDIHPFGAGEVLYETFSPADKLYIIDRGQVEIVDGENPRLLLGNGMACGFNMVKKRDDGVVTQRPTADYMPNHDARVTMSSSIFVIDREKYESITGRAPDEAASELREKSRKTLQDTPVFKAFGDEVRDLLHGYCSHYQFSIHNVLMQQGEMGDSMWMLMDGSKAILHALQGDNALPSVPLMGPSYFGGEALIVRAPMHSTIEAKPESQWLRLSWRDFRAFLREAGAEFEQKLDLSPEARRTITAAKTRQRYSWLSEDETLIIFQRRHWIELFRKVLPSVFIMLFVLLLLGLLWLAPQFATFFALLIALSVFLAMGQFLWGLMDYRNDFLLVTNQRVVQQEKVIFFNEYQKVALLEQIQNVDYFTTFFGRLLNYGFLQIQTAGSDGRIVFSYVPNPDEIKSELLRQQGLRQQHQKASSRQVIHRILTDRFGISPKLPATVVPESDGSDDSGRERGILERFRDWMRIGPHMRMEISDHVIWRKHVIVLLPKMTGPILAILLAIIIAIGPGWFPLPSLGAGLLIELIAGIFLLSSLAWAAWVVADWRNDTYEVTPVEVIDVEKKPLFFAELRRTGRLEQIENIDLSMPSPVHAILNYGNVLLQTAATDGDFTFTAVPDPRGVVEELRRRIELYRQLEAQRNAQERAREMPDWFENYNRIESDIVRDPEKWR